MLLTLLLTLSGERLLPVVTVETTSPRQASAVVGKPHTFRVALASTADSCDGFTIYEVVGLDDAATFTVWLPPDDEQPDTFSAEGTLRITRHPPCRLHDGLTEYRIIARR